MKPHTIYSICQNSFNRYMVECESVHIKRKRDWLVVLIDTWWNVNMIILVVPISASGF